MNNFKINIQGKTLIASGVKYYFFNLFVILDRIEVINQNYFSYAAIWTNTHQNLSLVLPFKCPENQL